MNKDQTIEQIKVMLDSLRIEHEYGGFSEYSQFCEEWLFKNLQYLSTEGLKKLATDINKTSQLAISFRHPEGQIRYIKLGIR
ncbi:hypothetical protein D3C74_402170 [compost metagenome]